MAIPFNPATRPDATLSALTVGNLTLAPEFDPSVTEYAVATANATNKVTATPTDGDATVSITLGESTPVTNGASATWSTGENVLTIVVANGGETKTYTVTVTKS